MYVQYYSKATIDWCIKFESPTDYTSTLLLSDKQREKKPTSPVLIPVTKALKYNKNVHKIIYVFDKCDDTSLGKLQESLPITLKISKQNL